MSTAEFEAGWLGYRPSSEHAEPVNLPMHTPGRHLNNIRKSTNWASADNPEGKIKMFEVKNQGGCGSCWAFAVTSTLEGTLAIKTKKDPFRISEQQGVDCTLAADRGGGYNKKHFGDAYRDYDCWGCSGCWMRNHFNFLKDHGAMRESDYRYEAKELKECKHDFDNIVGKVDFYEQIRNSVDAMKERVA